MTDPSRAERLWLVIALASLRAAMTAAQVSDPLPRWAPPSALRQHQPCRTTPCYPRLNILKRGMLLQLVASIRHQLLPGSLLAPVLPRPPLLEVLQ